MSRKIKVLYIGNFLSFNRGSISIAEKLSQELSQQENSSVEFILTSRLNNRCFRAINVFYAVLFYDYDFAFIDVFSGNSFNLANISSVLLKLRGKQAYYVIRGGNFINFFVKNKIKVTKALNRAQQLFSPSMMICDFLTSYDYIIKYLPNYIDRSSFPCGEELNKKQHSILWVRAFSSIYNPDLAIRIFSLVSKKLPQATLSMVGPDLGELESTKKLVLEMGLSDKVFFWGPIPNKELFKLYQTHYIYLNTTSFESFGMSLLEAASCGIPFVSSDVGEIPKIWTNGVNALLFPLDNIQLASEHILCLMEKSNVYNSISQKSKLRVNDFEKEKILQVWYSILGNCSRLNNLPGLLFVGSFLSSSNGTIGPSEQIIRFLRNRGFYIHSTSVIILKWTRLVNILENILFGTRNIKLLHIDVFSGNAFYFAYISALAGRAVRKKYIITLHGGKLPEFYRRNKKLFLSLMNHASLITTPSLYLKAFFENHSYNVEYIPNPLDLKTFNVNNAIHKEKSSFKILWVRAFKEIYDPFFAINVLKLVRDSGLNATLTMVGPDLGMLDSVKYLSKKLNVLDFVNFVGPCRNHDLPQYYQSHDCYINTTLYESFGVSLMEAASCGLPICSNNVGEIPYLWRDKIEYLGNEPKNSEQMAKNIIELAQNNELRNYLVSNALQKPPKYEVSSIVKLWESKLKEVCLTLN